jgi:hypothetical protein
MEAWDGHNSLGLMFSLFHFWHHYYKVTHENDYFIYNNSFFIYKRLHISCRVDAKT